jgi:hypothetical protein
VSTSREHDPVMLALHSAVARRYRAAPAPAGSGVFVSTWTRIMDLVDLIVLACSIVSPTICREYHLSFEMNGSLRTCAIQAQPTLAQWAGEHANLTVMRWRCEWPDRERRGT